MYPTLFGETLVTGPFTRVLSTITSHPDVMLGKPCIAGTRITVELVLRKIAAGWSIDDLCAAYPELQRTQIQSAIEYAAESMGRQHHPDAAE